MSRGTTVWRHHLQGLEEGPNKQLQKKGTDRLKVDEIVNQSFLEKSQCPFLDFLTYTKRGAHSELSTPSLPTLLNTVLAPLAANIQNFTDNVI